VHGRPCAGIQVVSAFGGTVARSTPPSVRATADRMRAAPCSTVEYTSSPAARAKTTPNRRTITLIAHFLSMPPRGPLTSPRAHLDPLELRDKAAQRRSQASFRILPEGLREVEAMRPD
jgi:hypothetical protein